MNKIRLAKSCIGPMEKEAVQRVLDGEFLGMGENVRLFEEELCEFIGGNRQVVCVNTGTSALHLALSCMDIGVGDEVLVPSITYVASFQAISATGAKPIACDVRKDTVFLDVADASRRITARTRAIMPVHYASDSSGMNDIHRLARDHDLRVVEDAAHSFGCVRDGQRIGAQGDVVCFSFDGIKNITAGEGGAVVTGDEELAQRVRDARLLGVEKDTEARFKGERSWDFDVRHQGYRYHMSNIMAEIGRVQLKRFGEFAAKRKTIAKHYQQAFRGLNSVHLFGYEYDNTVPHLFPIVLKPETRPIVIEAAKENGIEVGTHYFPNHMLTKYRSNYRLPIAEMLCEGLLTLPLHPDITDSDVRRIVKLITDICVPRT